MKVVQTRVSPDLHKKLRMLSVSEGVPIRELLHEAIDDLLAKRKKVRRGSADAAVEVQANGAAQ